MLAIILSIPPDFIDIHWLNPLMLTVSVQLPELPHVNGIGIGAGPAGLRFSRFNEIHYWFYFTLHGSPQSEWSRSKWIEIVSLLGSHILMNQILQLAGLHG